MTLIEAQEKYIEQVNRCVRPRDRKSRVRRSAGAKLRAYLTRIGVPESQQGAICRDAWDMAELEYNSED
jgi:hypothetical protein